MQKTLDNQGQEPLILFSTLSQEVLLKRLEKEIFPANRPLPVSRTLGGKRWDGFLGQIEQDSFWIMPAIPRPRAGPDDLVVKGAVATVPGGCRIELTFQRRSGPSKWFRWPEAMFITMGLLGPAGLAISGRTVREALPYSGLLVLISFWGLTSTRNVIQNIKRQAVLLVSRAAASTPPLV